jgi:hypothetical protein
MKAPDHLAGKAIKCPKCQAIVKIPGGAAAPTQRPAPAPMAAARPPAGKTLPAHQAPLDDLEEVNEKTAPKLAGTKLPSAELPDDLKEEVDNELTTGERIVYVGQPVPRVIFMRGLKYMIGGIVMLVLGLGVFGFQFFRPGGGIKFANTQALLFLLVPVLIAIVSLGALIAPSI